jgi:hypothetical protein
LLGGLPVFQGVERLWEGCGHTHVEECVPWWLWFLVVHLGLCKYVKAVVVPLRICDYDWDLDLCKLAGQEG